MTDSDRERDSAQPEALDEELERTRKLILERRNRFMAAALAGIGMATSGCTRASVCLEPPFQVSGNGGGGSGGFTGRPSVCLSPSITPPPVVGSGGGTGGTRPRPSACLSGSSAPPPGGNGGGGGTSGVRPSVCLSGTNAPVPCTPGAAGCEPDDGGMDDGGDQA